MPKIGSVVELDAEGVAGVVVRYDVRHPDQKLRILTRALLGLAVLDEALAGIVVADPSMPTAADDLEPGR